MKKLSITQFGNKLLREQTYKISESDVLSEKIQSLIIEMRNLLINKQLGIGLAAPQVGYELPIAVIELQKTPLRINVEELSLVIINPTITKSYGNKTQMWEGCISSGNGKASLFAKVPRYKKIELIYIDEKAITQKRTFEGLAAHVIQHEVDHLNGTLFVDKVKDNTTYMTYKEYKKMQNT